MKRYFVYILGNERPTLYVGVTNNLVRRVHEHRLGEIEGFTKKYDLKKILHFEEFSEIEEAIIREKRIKWWKRDWKLELVQRHNPGFRDLYPEIIQDSGSSPE